MILKEGSFKDAGIIPEKIKLIEQRASEWLEDGAFHGIVLAACRKGIIFLKKAFGKLTPATDSPDLTTGAIFPMSSITKPVTSTCIMQLVENGLVELNYPVKEYIPEFKGDNKENVFLYNLLTHTSGINGDYIWDNLVNIDNNPDIPPAPEGVHPFIYRTLITSYRMPLANPPGKVMQYCNAGYELLGEVIRRVSGLTLNEYAQKNIFEPLGMNDSHFILPDEKLPRVVKRNIEDSNGEWLNDPEHHKQPSAAGGLYSTALDMITFCQMFLNKGSYNGKRILHPSSIEQMSMNQTPGLSAYFKNKFIEVSSWGYGWNVRSNKRDDGGILRSASSLQHGGSGGCGIYIDPEYDLVYVFFSTDRGKSCNRDLFSNMITCAMDD